MASYDAGVIRGYAEDMYRTARLTVIVHALIGGLLGLGPLLLPFGGGSGAVLLTVPVFAGVGYLLGQSKAGSLRLAAQVALCQVEIEANTKDHEAASGSPGRTASVPTRPAVTESKGVPSDESHADYRCASCTTTFMGDSHSVCPECGSSVKTPLR